MPAAPEGRSRRRGATKSSKGSKAAVGTSTPGSATRTAFSFASVFAVALNVAVLVLVPLWPEEWQPMRRRCPPGSTASQELPSTSTTSTLQTTSTTTTTSTLTSTLHPAAAPGVPSVQEVTFDDDSLGYAADGPQNTWSSLGALDPSSLRILPDAAVEARARASPCWLAFGLSSVHRKKAEYLGATLSHLFIALGSTKDATIVVHLADFDTDWVAAESKWLLAGFSDEVEVGRLHVIHAPERIYNVKQVAFRSLVLSGFHLPEVNCVFLKQQGLQLGGHQSFLSSTGLYVLYFCARRESERRRRWVISSLDELKRFRDSECPAVVQAPRDQEALDPNVRGWEELKDGQWMLIAGAGVTSFQIDEGEPLKFGDAPQRQRWRSKQNLDYAFLMWYSAGLSQYYMQLEDDVHVVPNFLQTVRRYVEVRMVGTPWVMIAFSKLGFIGKLLNSSHVQSLGQFLHVFHDEAPCDWLVWVWIDILSPEPISTEIVRDLEAEWGLREARRANPATKLPKSFRNDVAMYYKPPGPPLFATAAKPVDNSKPKLAFYEAKTAESPSNPLAQIRSTMAQFQHYHVAHAYPPGEPSWFWTSDTCWPREQTKACVDPASKFVELGFMAPVQLREVKVIMGSSGHEQDYIRSGSLQISHRLIGQNPSDGCIDYEELLPVKTPNVVWQGNVALANVRCIKLVLTAAQEQWVALQEISVVQDVASGAPAVANSNTPMPLVTTTTTSLTSTVTSSSLAGVSTGATVRRTDGNAVDVVGEAVVTERAGMKQDVSDEAWEDAADVAAPLAALLAALVGLLAGCAGWCCVYTGRRHCWSGVQEVGEFTCWMLSFMLLLDTLLLFTLSPPWPPLALKSREEVGNMVTCVPSSDLRSPRLRSSASALSSIATFTPTTMSTSQPTSTTTGLDRFTLNVAVPSDRGWQLNPKFGRPLDRSALLPPIRRLDLDQLLIKGLWAPAPAPVAATQGSDDGRKWLVIGVVLDVASQPLETIMLNVKKLLEAGKGLVVLLLHIPHEGAPASRQRGAVINHLRKEMAKDIEAGLLCVMSTPSQFYLSPPARRENIEHALMLMAGIPLGHFYMQIEPDCQMLPDFLSPLKGFVDRLERQGIEGVAQSTASWNMISITQGGFYRKFMRTSVVLRLAELLVMFPEVSADVLLWDFIDIIANSTAPKACKIALVASKRRRPDVLLQYHKSEALIEHVGDSSSLAGKVQRIKDEYFKTHALANNLFDNPPAKVRSNLVNSKGLQEIYGFSSTAMTSASVRNRLWKSAGIVTPVHGGEAFFEIVFQAPVDLVIFNLQMGGHLAPPAKGKKAEVADPEFDHVLHRAFLHFGHRPSNQGENPNVGACLEYNNMGYVSGRELFWRSPSSRPVRDVSCIKISIFEAQNNPLIVRSMSVRSANGLQAIIRPSSAVNLLPEVRTTTTSTTSSSITTTSSGESLEDRAQREHHEQELALDRWAESHFAWALTVSLAFGSGALAGVLGFFASRLFGTASGRRIRPYPP